jgi:hypothetical protein
MSIKKKEDEQTINNISIILDIFFKKNSPFYIDGKRYTVFSYDWDNIITSIKKNGRVELYNGDESSKTQITPPTITFKVLIQPLNNLIMRINVAPVVAPVVAPAVVPAVAPAVTPVVADAVVHPIKTQIEEIIATIDAGTATILGVIECLKNVNSKSPYKRDNSIQTTLENMGNNSTPVTVRKIGQLVPIINILFTSASEILFIWERMDTLYNKFNKMMNDGDILDILDFDDLYKISEEYHYLKGKACAQNLVDNAGDTDEVKKFNHLWQWCNNPKYNSWYSLQSISQSCTYANNNVINLYEFLKNPLEYDHDEIFDLIDDYHIYRNIASASGYSNQLQQSQQPKYYYDLNIVICNENNENNTPLYKSYTAVQNEIETKSYLNDMKGFREKLDEYKKLTPTIVKPIDSSIVGTFFDSFANTIDNMWFGRGGANVYVDIGVDDSMHYEKEEKRNVYAKTIQEQEMKLSNVVESVDKDKESAVVVQWNYNISISIYLYPGDKIPLSAFASLYCSKKKDNIYNLFTTVMSPKDTVDKNKNKTIKKPLGIYTPVLPQPKPDSDSSKPNNEITTNSQSNKTQKIKQT